jgi:hypothetical protein
MKCLILPVALLLLMQGIATNAIAADTPLGQSVRILISAQTANQQAGLASPEALPPIEGMHTDKVVNAYLQKKPANAKTASARGALSLGSGR